MVRQLPPGHYIWSLFWHKMISWTDFEEMLFISSNSHWEKFSPMRINKKGVPGYVYKSNTPNTKRAICLFFLCGCLFAWKAVIYLSRGEVKWSISCSIMSGSLWHGLWTTRLLCAWNSPGKSTGVVCHFLFQGIFPIQGLNLGLQNWRQILPSEPPG